jgi:uncharacterized membrane protein YqjE
MDLRTLESLQRAIPVVLRHLDAYAELAERDFAAAKSVAVARVKALVLLGVSGVFALLLACALVIALTWESEYRVATIGTMIGFFALCALGSAAWFMRKRQEPFGAVRREWREDRAWLQRVLSRDT